MKKYKVTAAAGCLSHGSVRYEAGATIELATEAAEQLVNLGAVILCDEPPSEPPQDKQPSDTVTGNGSGQKLPPADNTEKTDGEISNDEQPSEPLQDQDDQPSKPSAKVQAITAHFLNAAPDGDSRPPTLDITRQAMGDKSITKEERDEAWEIYCAQVANNKEGAE